MPWAAPLKVLTLKRPETLGMERVPGGSSGGSAAAVVAGEAIYSLGSDTGGSIRQPASFCGCVGLKPTYGLISRFGLVSYASSLDQIGPLTKTVTDCALVLNAIAGHDPMDLTSSRRIHPDYTKALINDVKGMKIGLPREFIDDSVEKNIRDAILNAVKILLIGSRMRGNLHTSYGYVVTYYIIALAEASST